VPRERGESLGPLFDAFPALLERARHRSRTRAVRALRRSPSPVEPHSQSDRAPHGRQHWQGSHPEPRGPAAVSTGRAGIERDPCNAGGRAEPGQIVSAVPQEKEIGVALELRAFLIGVARLSSRAETRRRAARGSLHALWALRPRSGFLLATRPVVRWVELPRSM